MKRNTIAKLSIALLIVSGLVWSGCGLNQADDASPNTEAAIEVAAAIAADTEAAAIEARRAALADREAELARLERQVDRRLRELEQRVEQVATVEAEPARKETRAPLTPRPRRLEDQVQPASRTIRLTLPQATPLQAELIDFLSSETQLPGDPVEARVVADVLRNGTVAIPRGSMLRGTVEEAVAQKKFGGQARLTVVFDSLQLVSGDRIPVTAYFTAEGKKQKKKDAATIGGAAAGGAVLGRVLSKNDKTKGTLLGAVLGGAIGTAVASQTNGDPVEFAAGSVIELFLDAPTTVVVEAAQAASTVASNR